MYWGEKNAEHVRIAGLWVEILNSCIPNRKQPKYRNAREQLYQLDVPFTIKWMWKGVILVQAPKSLGFPVRYSTLEIEYLSHFQQRSVAFMWL